MHRFAMRAAAAMALASSAQLAAAETQAASCLTRAELRGMVAYFLPSVLGLTITTCSKQLKPDSYLLGRGPLLLTTLEAGRPEAWPMAKQAFMKMGENGDKSSSIFDALPEEVIRPIVEAAITQKLGTSIKPENCGDINNVMAPLEPLPEANMIDVLTEVMTLAGRRDRQLRVCRDS